MSQTQTDAIQFLQQTAEPTQPRLTLAVETPSSASPFPSPSSTFFPPPIPSSHEFASKIVNNKRYRAKSVGNKDRDKERLKLSCTTGDTAAATAAAAALSDGTPIPPSTRSAGASPSHVTNPLPAFDPPDISSPTADPAAPLTTSVLPASGSTPPGAPSQFDAASSSLVSPATRNSSIPTPATAGPSPVTDDVQRTRPADGANTHTFASSQQPHPQALSPQLPSPYDSLLLLNAQTSSPDTIIPASIQTLAVPQHSEDEQDIYNDGTSTPVARRRPESGTSLSMALAGPTSLSRASSLSSSRPAPPSPVPSRRASQQILQRNPSLRRSTSSIGSATGGSNLGRSASTRSTRSTATANRRSSTFSMTSLAPPIDTTASGLLATVLSPTVEQPSPAGDGSQPPRSIIVRDFAYSPEDHWFGARPLELLPRRERESKRDSSASRSSSGLGGWGSYSSSSKALGTKSGKKKKKGGWAALGKFLSKRNSGQPESGSEDPSEGDDDEDEGSYEDGDDVRVDSGYEDDDAGGGEQIEEELKPGLYRALYAFEPEGTAEMALVEDQIVRVIARGGGVGWAIVERPAEKGDGAGGFGLEAAGQALVPESYLEPYRLDDEDEDDD